MPPPRPFTFFDWAHRIIVTACAGASVYGLYGIWAIHRANLDAGANYMAALKQAQAEAIAEGREPPQKLEAPPRQPS